MRKIKKIIHKIKGFTLIELLVVITILGVLAAAVLVAINPGKRMNQARISGALQFAQQIDRSLGFEVASQWDFNNSSNPSQGADTSGNNNDGTITGATYDCNNTPFDEVGQTNETCALRFDGVDDRVNVGANSTLNVGRPNMTISAWVYPMAFTDTMAVANKNGPYLLWINTNKGVTTGLYKGSIWYWYSSPNNSISANTWNHILMTYNGTNRKIYIDGKQSGSADTQISGDIDIVGSSLSIGYDACCARYYFNGLIDDVRIYSSSLTSKQVEQMYAQTAPRYVAAPNFGPLSKLLL